MSYGKVVIDTVREYLGEVPVEPHMSFDDLSMDSMDTVEILVTIERRVSDLIEMHYEFSGEEKFQTLQDVIDYLDEHMPSSD